jgi:hypothetical protein
MLRREKFLRDDYSWEGMLLSWSSAMAATRRITTPSVGYLELQIKLYETVKLPHEAAYRAEGYGSISLLLFFYSFPSLP